MGSSLIKVQCISLEEAIELFLMENEEVIQAFSSHASQKTFTRHSPEEFDMEFEAL